MTEQHTPGPWKLGEEIVLGGDEMTEPEILTIIEAEGYGIIGYAEATPVDDKELKANADLIAAAPELLVLLKRLDAWALTCPTVSEPMANILKDTRTIFTRLEE